MKDMTIEEMRAMLKDLEVKQNDLTKALKEKETQEAEIKKKKLAEEREKRRAAVCALMDETERALDEYIRDYGTFIRHTKDDNDSFLARMYHQYLF